MSNWSTLFDLDMLARSSKDRSRSPHRNDEEVINQANSSANKQLSSTAQSSNKNDTSQLDITSNETNVTATTTTTTNNNNNHKVRKENESQLRMKSLKVR